MRIVKTQQEVDALHRASAIPAALLNQVEDYFNQLRVELDYEAESEFRLGGHGYIMEELLRSKLLH
jgi:Xaa-Pro aminopeptidase